MRNRAAHVYDIGHVSGYLPDGSPIFSGSPPARLVWSGGFADFDSRKDAILWAGKQGMLPKRRQTPPGHVDWDAMVRKMGGRNTVPRHGVCRL